MHILTMSNHDNDLSSPTPFHRCVSTVTLEFEKSSSNEPVDNEVTQKCLNGLQDTDDTLDMRHVKITCIC